MMRAWCALALSAALLVVAAERKRAEAELLNPMPFALGSRYGRSPQRLITARNDRFFMTAGRYGKRSEGAALLCRPTGGGPTGGGPTGGGPTGGGPTPLYRCTPAGGYMPEYPLYDRRSEETQEE